MTTARGVLRSRFVRTWLSLALLPLVPACAGSPPPAGCRPITVDTGHVAAATAMERPGYVHLVAEESAGCGCTPQIDLDPTTEVVTAAACGCADGPCTDSGYDSTARILVFAGVGTQPQLTFEPALSTTMVDPAHCVASDATVSSLEVLAPLDGWRHQAPIVGWVQLNARAPRCCGTPLTLVTPTVNADFTIDLAISECRPDTCDCASGTPTDASTPVPLGELPAGTYTVRAGGASTTLVIP